MHHPDQPLDDAGGDRTANEGAGRQIGEVGCPSDALVERPSVTDEHPRHPGPSDLGAPRGPTGLDRGAEATKRGLGETGQLAQVQEEDIVGPVEDPEGDEVGTAGQQPLTDDAHDLHDGELRLLAAAGQGSIREASHRTVRARR